MRKGNRMQEAKKTLLRVIGLIWALAAVVAAVGVVIWLFFPFRLLPYLLGELLGSAVSAALMFHRYSTLDVKRNNKEQPNKIASMLRAIKKGACRPPQERFSPAKCEFRLKARPLRRFCAEMRCILPE